MHDLGRKQSAPGTSSRKRKSGEAQHPREGGVTQPGNPEEDPRQEEAKAWGRFFRAARFSSPNRYPCCPDPVQGQGPTRLCLKKQEMGDLGFFSPL